MPPSSSFRISIHSFANSTGDGFWRCRRMPLYYDLALGIPRPDGLTLSSGGAPSPGFIRALLVWMWAVGPGPAAAALLNVCCYLVGCLLVMKLLRGEERATRLLVGAFTFSPALIVFGSQPLKDAFFLGLVVALCAAASLVMAHAGERRRGTAMWLDGVMLAMGFFLLASIRSYYAIFLLAALGAALPLAAFAARRGVVRTLGRAAAVLAISAAEACEWVITVGRRSALSVARTTRSSSWCSRPAVGCLRCRRGVVHARPVAVLPSR
jgi:hypothetical protein